MAFKNTYLNHNISDDGRRELTIKEFKRWLMRVDSDNDGRISKSDLRHIIRATGGWFAHLKAKAAIKSADKDGDGFIDEREIQNLTPFAEKEFGIRIIPY